MVGVGDNFQQQTKYIRKEMSAVGPDWEHRPRLYKEYSGHRKIALHPPVPNGSTSIDEALKRRKSIRQFSTKSLNEKQLSYLLWASTGVQRQEGEHEFRTAPSAGALYPIETYLVVSSVEDIPQGVYHYSIGSHALEELNAGDFRRAITIAAMGQRMCMEATVVFIWTAIFQRSKWKYGQRAYRYVYLDAGHIAENLALSATSIGIGSCHIAAIFDDEVNEILGVDGSDESAIYMTVLGWPR